MPTLHVESDFSDFKNRFEEIKEKEAEMPILEVYNLLSDFLDRLRSRYYSVRGDWLKTMDSDIRKKMNKFSDLRSKARKHKMRLLRMKSKKVV